jgi:hypothetical protein
MDDLNPKDLDKDGIQRVLEDLATPCNRCMYALIDHLTAPCDNCVGTTTNGDFKAYDWKENSFSISPPSRIELLEMRIEYLEAIVLDLLDNPSCACSKIVERRDNGNN